MSSALGGRFGIGIDTHRNQEKKATASKCRVLKRMAPEGGSSLDFDFCSAFAFAVANCAASF